LKAKRAAELVITNKELIFQNKGKRKRAAELVIANKTLKTSEEKQCRINHCQQRACLSKQRKKKNGLQELVIITKNLYIKAIERRTRC
jgi:hypothetical protein